MGTGPAGSVFGENSSYRETRGTRRGVARRLNVVLTPPPPPLKVAYPEVTIVRVVGTVAPYACGGSVFGENSFYRSDKPKTV